MLSELHSLNLKLRSKSYNKKFVLHLIGAPQLSSGRQHNYSTKTRQAGRANGQSMYSLMSMHLPHHDICHTITFFKAWHLSHHDIFPTKTIISQDMCVTKTFIPPRHLPKYDIFQPGHLSHHFHIGSTIVMILQMS